jgi:hypothetical protein
MERQSMGMFEQATLTIQNEQTFGEVIQALGSVFSTKNVEDFLRRIKRAGLRARDFEGVLSRGLLGKEAQARYVSLEGADQGQVREKYLSMVEKVAPELRARFLKVYAYY